MKSYFAISKEAAASVLHAKDYAQLETLANRAAFERSLVKDLISEDAYWEKIGARCPEDTLLFNMEDVRQRLSCHEQRMLENFMRLYDHAVMEDILDV